MGLDVRDIPREAAEELPERLRHAGFDVEVIREAHSQFPDVVITRVKCRRGEDVQWLIWSPVSSWGPASSKSNEYRVEIVNAWSWWPSVYKRRSRLQKGVTAIIEQSGGYSPFPDGRA